jgi:hypothetical protein
MADLGGDKAGDLPGGDGLRAGQMPGLPDDAADRAVAVDVLQAHQQRAGALSRRQYTALERREEFRRLRIWRVQVLVHQRGALARNFGQGHVSGPSGG